MMITVTHGPTVHFLQFLLRRPHLDTSLDTVRRQRTSPILLKLLEDLLLHLRNTPGEVVETICFWLGAVDCECQVVVLEVETDTRQVDERLHAGVAKLLRVTDTRALKDEWRAESASGDDNLLASPVNSGGVLSRSEWLGRHGRDADCSIALEDDLVYLGVADKVQVLVDSTSAVDVSMGRVLGVVSLEYRSYFWLHLHFACQCHGLINTVSKLSWRP
jgi:hypothetical protein